MISDKVTSYSSLIMAQPYDLKLRIYIVMTRILDDKHFERLEQILRMGSHRWASRSIFKKQEVPWRK